MSHRSFAYRDPLDVLISAEARTCKGCMHLVTLWGVDVCAKDPSKQQNKLRHCGKYEQGAKK